MNMESEILSSYENIAILKRDLPTNGAPTPRGVFAHNIIAFYESRGADQVHLFNTNLGNSKIYYYIFIIIF